MDIEGHIRSRELPGFWRWRGVTPARWMHTETGTQEEEQDLRVGRAWGYKSSEAPLSRVLLGGINGFMEPDMRLWGGLNWEGALVWLPVGGIQRDTLQLTGSIGCEGASVPAVEAWHWDRDFQRVSWMGRLESFLNTESTENTQLASTFCECSVLIGMPWTYLRTFVFWFIGLGSLTSWTTF